MTLRDRDVPIVIGGGYGLLLRQRYVAESGLRTLRKVPSARSTEDLDVFLTAEVIADTGRVRALRDALLALGYEAIPGAEYYQFGRDADYLGQSRRVKIDLLASRPGSDESRRKLKIKDRRVRPRNVRGIHAHTSPAAVSETAPGMLALQEHGRRTGVLYSESDMAGFLRDLHELFPSPAGVEDQA